MRCSVLGYELSHAIALLERQGYTIKTAKVSSRKGQSGNERRVVREQERDGTICLTYAVFRTVIGSSDLSD